MKAFAEILAVVTKGGTLDRAGAREAMFHLVSEATPDADITAFLNALRGRAPHEEELVGFATALREKAVRVPTKRTPLVDTCGTGGDGLHTFNLSTAAAFAAAGAGAAVAKHGNRSVSSRSGSADVLEALGAPIDVGPEAAARALETTGFAFLMAPRYHPAMKRVGPVRKSMGVRTVFNLLGPMVNPALVTRQVVGIYDPSLLETYAKVLLALGAERVMVVHSEDGMDELSLAVRTRVCHGSAKGLSLEWVSPEDAGVTRSPLETLKGGDARENAAMMERVLSGEKGPLADGTALNAGAALVVAGLAGDLKEGVALARKSLGSGAAKNVLERLRGEKK